MSHYDSKNEAYAVYQPSLVADDLSAVTIRQNVKEPFKKGIKH